MGRRRRAVMGVRFGRDYNEILKDLTAAICEVERFYEFFSMDDDAWSQLCEEEQGECVRTLADDLFYGLGTEPTMYIGRGVVHYDISKHVITVNDGEKCVSIVYLT
jgi:hypothetical protein